MPKLRPRPRTKDIIRPAGAKPAPTRLARNVPVKKSPAVIVPARTRADLVAQHARVWLKRGDHRYAVVGLVALALGVVVGLGIGAPPASSPVAVAAAPGTSPGAAPALAVAAVAPETTGSVAAATPPAAPPPREMVAGLPVIPTWKLLEVKGNVATVEGHDEVFRVRIGSNLQNGGRITEFRRDGDRWLVITTTGVVLPR